MAVTDTSTGAHVEPAATRDIVTTCRLLRLGLSR